MFFVFAGIIASAVVANDMRDLELAESFEDSYTKTKHKDDYVGVSITPSGNISPVPSPGGINF